MTITDDQKVSLETQLEQWFNSETSDNDEWEQAKQRLTKLDRMEKNLQEIFLEEQVSKEDYKEHRLRIQALKTNLKYLVDTIESRRGLVRSDFEFILRLANNLDSIFEKGDNDNRRLLCETLFKQVRIREGKIVDVEMNLPFKLIVSQTKGTESLPSGQPEKPWRIRLAVRTPPSQGGDRGFESRMRYSKRDITWAGNQSGEYSIRYSPL